MAQADAGKVRGLYLGDYTQIADPSAIEISDVVLYNNSSYAALQDAPTDTPSTSSTQWQLIVRGSDVSGVKGDAEATYRQGDVNITKANIGLGNVPNVTTDDQTPTVTEAATRVNVASGDTLKTIVGKIKKFFADLKTVAFTGSYNDLTDKPTIPSAQVNSDWNAVSGVAQILNKPDVSLKQDKTMSSAVTIDGTSQTTVEGAISALNTYADKKQNKTLSSAITIEGTSRSTVETALAGLNTYADDLDDAISAITNVYSAKNILPNEAVSQTVNGVTFTVNEDKSISTSGTANADVYYAISKYEGFKPKSYYPYYSGNIANGCTGGSLSTYRMYIDYSDDGSTWGGSVAIMDGDVTIPDHPYYANCNIFVANGTNMTGKVFKPMIRDSRIPDATYEPFAKTNQQLTKDVSGISNPNLLLNPFFTVNTKGLTSYGVTWQETVDRWYCIGTAGTSIQPISLNGVASIVEQGYLAEAMGNMLRQKSRTFTASIILDGKLYSFNYTSIADGQTHTTQFPTYIDDIRIALVERDANLSNNDTFTIYLNNTTTAHTITAVKLEEGEVSTLLNDVAPDHTLEAAKCQSATGGEIAFQRALTDIIVNGTTNNTGSTIKQGTYFYLNGQMSWALTDIANGATFTQNTNYALRTLKSGIITLRGPVSTTFTSGEAVVTLGTGITLISAFAASTTINITSHTLLDEVSGIWLLKSDGDGDAYIYFAIIG